MPLTSVSPKLLLRACCVSKRWLLVFRRAAALTSAKTRLLEAPFFLSTQSPRQGLERRVTGDTANVLTAAAKQTELVRVYCQICVQARYVRVTQQHPLTL